MGKKVQLINYTEDVYMHKIFQVKAEHSWLLDRYRCYLKQLENLSSYYTYVPNKKSY